MIEVFNKEEAKKKSGPLEVGIWGITLLLLFSGAYMVYKLHPDFKLMHFKLMQNTFGMFTSYLSLFLLIVTLGFTIFLLVLYLRYKPIPSVSDEELLDCSIIVPAYNEGSLVYQTLKSLANSNYPKDKMSIIAIDDGSKDDTWEWIKKAKEELGGIVTIFQQPHNQGKRHALHRGFLMGKGDIFITVDSDSVVDKETIRNMVSPFVLKENCSAVAGNVRVLNNEKEIIPRMLNVSFVFSFEYIRSAQSTMGSVFCTPGALAAYRKEAVMNCLDEWVNQTFLGQPSDIGEDRAMTNMILKQGYHVLFQSNALVYTNTPERYNNLYKMFVRWGRSNVRESIMMSQFAFKNFREGSKFGPRLLLIMEILRLVLVYPLLLLMVWSLISHPLLFISSTLMGILIYSSIQALFFALKTEQRTEALWAYAYSIFFSFSLFWITPYAIATASRRGWLTRDLNTN